MNGAHVETLYALKLKGGGQTESRIEYRVAPSIAELWQAVSDDKGLTPADLRYAGWRAVKVVVQEV